MVYLYPNAKANPHTSLLYVITCLWIKTNQANCISNLSAVDLFTSESIYLYIDLCCKPLRVGCAFLKKWDQICFSISTCFHLLLDRYQLIWTFGTQNGKVARFFGWTFYYRICPHLCKYYWNCARNPSIHIFFVFITVTI